MPELPEVEVLSRKLRDLLVGSKIIGINVYNSAKIKGIKPELVLGKTIVDVGRRGKHLYIGLSSGDKLVFHLRLKGKLVYGLDSGELNAPWIELKFDTGKSLFFGDPRKMATLDVVRDLREIKAIANMGPEPLSDQFTLNFLKEGLAKSSKAVKALLMDQSFVAGIGNIYADEILFRAGVHPERKAKTVSSSEAEKLYISIKEVLREALEHRGVGEYTSLFSNDKEIGDFEKLLKVHGKEGMPCPRCKVEIKRIEVSGRGTYFCPKCQV
ncbi:MAG: DNA-formamidopyrimidine glycosylase [Synergistetes bacterium]|nr:DNA-formamidopyrimidine glycosylase [Synergistota bacterium]MCX8127426.1 DNA-formamidopyrimidine glycosylase [Synergistota bacterium]MDW8192290.1 DNA-formamidopyrimidine glycosylase [Synergistota bacterium]